MCDDPKKCVRCGNFFVPEIDEDECGQYEVNTKLCFSCFEDCVEEHEERKRERIARENEY